MTDSTQTLDKWELARLESKLEAIISALRTHQASQTHQASLSGKAYEAFCSVVLRLEREVEVILTSAQDMRAINAEFMGRDYPTDVLSFPLDEIVVDEIVDSSGFGFEALDASAVESSELNSNGLSFNGLSSGELDSCTLDSSDVDSNLLDSSDFAPTIPLGSIVINLPLARQISCDLAHSLDDELGLLFLHALLHLLGFDHECDNGEHRSLESYFIELLHLPPSLIDRNSE